MPLDINAILREQEKTFYQEMFDSFPDLKSLSQNQESEALESFFNQSQNKLREELKKKSPEDSKFSADDEEIYDKIIGAKLAIERIKKSEDNPEQKKEELESLVERKIIPLIHQVFSSFEIDRDEYNQLVGKFANYQHRSDARFLSLYLQFLTRCAFFVENQNEKASLFCAFHSEIEKCADGMVTRLFQYIGSNIIQENILTVLQKRIIQSRFLGSAMQIHALPYINEFLFGIASDDVYAIDVSQFIPLPLLEDLSRKALSGDYLEELFSLELKNFILTLLEMSKEEFEEKMLDSHGEFIIYSNSNNYIKKLSEIAEIIIVATSSESDIEVAPRDIIPFSSLQREIFLQEDADGNYVSRSYEEVQQVIARNLRARNFGSKEIFAELLAKQALKEIKDNIKEKEEAERSMFARVKNALVSEDEIAILNKLSILYFSFQSLDCEGYLTTKDFIEQYCDLLCDYSPVEDAPNQSKLKFKEEVTARLPKTIKDYLEKKISSFKISRTVDGARKVIAPSNDLTAQKFISALRSNTELLRMFQERNPQDKLEVNIHSFLVLIKNRIILPERNSNLSINVGNQFATTLFYLSAEEFWHYFWPNLTERNLQNIIRLNNDFLGEILTNEYGKYLIAKSHKDYYNLLYSADISSGTLSKILLNVGADLARKNIDEFIFCLGEIRSRANIVAIMQSEAGEILATYENGIEFCKLLSGRSSADIVAILGKAAGEILLNKNKELFVLVINKIINEADILSFLKSGTGNIFATTNPELFIEKLTNIKDKKLISEFNKVGFFDDNNFETIVGAIYSSSDNHVEDLIESPVGDFIKKNHPELFIFLEAKSLLKDEESMLEFFIHNDGEKFIKKILKVKNEHVIQNLLNNKLGKVLIDRHLDKILSNYKKSELTAFFASKFGEVYLDKIVNLSLESKDRISTGKAGEFLSEHFPHIFLKLKINDFDKDAASRFFKSPTGKEFLSKFHKIKNQDSVIKAIQGNKGIYLIENEIEIFKKTLKALNHKSQFALLTSPSANILAKKYPEIFVSVSSKLSEKQITAILNEDKAVLLLAEENPEHFFQLLKKVKTKKNVADILKNTAAAKIIASKHPQFFSYDSLKAIGISKDQIKSVLFSDKVGASLATSDPGNFLKSFTLIYNKHISKGEYQQAEMMGDYNNLTILLKNILNIQSGYIKAGIDIERVGNPFSGSRKTIIKIVEDIDGINSDLLKRNYEQIIYDDGISASQNGESFKYVAFEVKDLQEIANQKSQDLEATRRRVREPGTSPEPLSEIRVAHIDGAHIQTSFV